MKPGNLLLRRDGQLKIGDFGIARAVELSGLTQDGTILGTAAYLAPEQARGEQVGPAADVYGLSAVLYELLTGRPPREVSSLADLTTPSRTPIMPVRDLAPYVPERIEEAVMSGLAARPDARPTAAALRAALARGRGGADGLGAGDDVLDRGRGTAFAAARHGSWRRSRASPSSPRVGRGRRGRGSGGE